VVHSDTSAIHSQTTVIESDSIVVESSVAVVEGWGMSSVASDTTAIESELILVHSETTVIQSDVALIETTRAEPGQGLPASTTSVFEKIDYLYKAWRNKSDQTSTLYQLYADDATTVDQKATVSDDATTFTKGEIATGP